MRHFHVVRHHSSQLKQERIPGDIALSVKLFYVERTLSATITFASEPAGFVTGTPLLFVF
jgi:hypothetical protein